MKEFITKKNRADATDYLKRLLHSDSTRFNGKSSINDILELEKIKDEGLSIKKVQEIFSKALTKTGKKRMVDTLRQKRMLKKSKICVSDWVRNELSRLAKEKKMKISDLIEQLLKKGGEEH